jgi:ribose-phosphate pyrophosphokinase
MLILTIDLTKTDNIVSFPDGQHSFNVDKSFLSEIQECELNITTPIRNWIDLEILHCVVATYRETAKCKLTIKLFITYLCGSRSDRKFTSVSCNYLKNVMAPVINILKLDKVFIFDPHSDVTEAVIDNFAKVGPEQFLDFCLNHITQLNNTEAAYVMPDHGATKRYYKYLISKNIQDLDIITCDKVRNEKGEIIRTDVPLSLDYSAGNIILIDDICDGGATFIAIAKEIFKLKEIILNSGGKWDAKLYLIISHGIFSKGLEELLKYFDFIFVTNSYKEILHPKIISFETKFKNRFGT